MNSSTESIRCPHCDEALQAFELPEQGGWQTDFHLVCFNNECSYYTRGWERMKSQYAVRASYRYRVDPATGAASPLPVWSPTALRDRILDAEATQTTDTEDKP